ncbi:hypothetical protein V8E54_007822 [Elaphomyces granulatus]
MWISASYGCIQHIASLLKDDAYDIIREHFETITETCLGGTGGPTRTSSTHSTTTLPELHRNKLVAMKSGKTDHRRSRPLKSSSPWNLPTSPTNGSDKPGPDNFEDWTKAYTRICKKRSIWINSATIDQAPAVPLLDARRGPRPSREQCVQQGLCFYCAENDVKFGHLSRPQFRNAMFNQAGRGTTQPYMPRPRNPMTQSPRFPSQFSQPRPYSRLRATWGWLHRRGSQEHNVANLLPHCRRLRKLNSTPGDKRHLTTSHSHAATKVSQVPITPGNVAQVDELFERIVEGEPGLDPATVLKIGPKRLGVESWLNLYTKILTKGKPREATSSYLIRHFVQSCESLNPSIFAAYSLQAEEGELKLTLEELINRQTIQRMALLICINANEDAQPATVDTTWKNVEMSLRNFGLMAESTNIKNDGTLSRAKEALHCPPEEELGTDQEPTIIARKKVSDQDLKQTLTNYHKAAIKYRHERDQQTRNVVAQEEATARAEAKVEQLTDTEGSNSRDSGRRMQGPTGTPLTHTLPPQALQPLGEPGARTQTNTDRGDTTWT